jgi:hypothetical protein
MDNFIWNLSILNFESDFSGLWKPRFAGVSRWLFKLKNPVFADRGAALFIIPTASRF